MHVTLTAASAASRPATAPISLALTRAHGYAALVTLMISGLCGLVVAVKFVLPDILADSPWATWGLLRYDHTQGIMFGWLAVRFSAFALAGRCLSCGTLARCCPAGR